MKRLLLAACILAAPIVTLNEKELIASPSNRTGYIFESEDDEFDDFDEFEDDEYENGEFENIATESELPVGNEATPGTMRKAEIRLLDFPDGEVCMVENTFLKAEE